MAHLLLTLRLLNPFGREHYFGNALIPVLVFSMSVLRHYSVEKTKCINLTLNLPEALRFVHELMRATNENSTGAAELLEQDAQLWGELKRFQELIPAPADQARAVQGGGHSNSNRAGTIAERVVGKSSEVHV